MGAVTWFIHLFKHPLDVKTFVQFYWYYLKRRNSSWKKHPNSGWDRPTMRRCWELFRMKDKGICILIKQLDGDLARVVALFCLALRALDTIEDDMTIPDSIKQPILRSFHIHTVTPEWKFDGGRPDDKYRQYLVEFDNVVEEINTLSPQYKNIIVNTAMRMGTGMADYAHKAAITGSIHIETVAEYDQYCHYAGGITMQAMSQMFSASGKESLSISTQVELSNSLGIFLQKSDIICDYKEDVDQQRYFWPREFWGREEYGFEELTDMKNMDPDTLRNAMYVQSAMVLDALRHATDALDYLRLLKDQSIFHISALVAVKSITDVGFCFMNKEVFQRKVRMRKAEAAKLVLRSTNMRDVALVFHEYSRKIQAKAVHTDPSFNDISIACRKIEKYCEPYCVEKLSTARTSMGGLMMYVGAAFVLIFALSLSHAIIPMTHSIVHVLFKG